MATGSVSAEAVPSCKTTYDVLGKRFYSSTLGARFYFEKCFGNRFAPSHNSAHWSGYRLVETRKSKSIRCEQARAVSPNVACLEVKAKALQETLNMGMQDEFILFVVHMHVAVTQNDGAPTGV